MERLGINSEEIIYFLNQPIIKYYLNVTALRNSPIKNINPRVKAQVELSNNDDKLYDFIKSTLIGSQDIKPVSTFELSNLKNTIEKFSSIPITNWKTNSTIPVREKELQFLVFRHFMQLKDYSNYIRASQQASNHDTANLNSLHILDDKDQLLDTFLAPTADNFITAIETGEPMASALRSRTFVENLTEKLNDLDAKFLSKDKDGLFRIQSRSVRMMLRSIMLRLNPFIFNENDKREMMDKITKVTINALVLNSDFNNKGKLIDNLDTVMKADKLRDTIAKVQAILKNPDETYKQQLKDANVDLAHLISNRWINNIDVETINPDSDYGYIAIRGTKPSDNFEKQVWIEDFRKIEKLPFTRNLYKSILAAAIYQGGAEHNRVSLLDLIPWEEYTPIINNGLDNLSQLGQTNLMRTIAQLKSFDKSYFVPKDFISTGKVNGIKYYAKTISLLGKAKDDVSVSALKDLYSPSSPYSTWLPASEHINPSGEKVTEISSVILVPFSPYQDKQEYFTLRQRSSNYETEEVKAMLEAKNSDYKTTILLEKAPMIYDNGLQTYLVYRPINTKGGRYIQELGFNNEYSKIDTHDKVNPHLTNDDVLYKLLSGKFGAFIKKTASFPETVIPSVVEEDPTSQDSNTTDDIPYEEVPDEDKQLPQSQKLLEDSTNKDELNPNKEELDKLHEIIINAYTDTPESIAANKRWKELTGEDWYPFQLNTFNDLFDNPQVATRIKQKANKALNEKLVEYLKRFNISVKELDSLQDKFGVDAAGVVDILNKAILLDKNKQGLDTLPEEAAHVFTMMMASNPDMDWMKDNIDKWEGYKQVYNDYYSQYEGNEARIKFEAVGKFIALHLIKNEPTVSEEVKAGILERLWKFIKELFGDKTDIERLNSIANEIATKVLNNEDLISIATPQGHKIVNTKEAFKNNYAAYQIHQKLKDKFLLTGSAALATQGTVFRADENPLHDLDYVVSDPSIDISRDIKDIFPNAEKIHNGIPNNKYSTKAFLIPPRGISVKNVTRQESGNYKDWITGYELYDKRGYLVGKYESKFEDGKLVQRQEGLKGFWVDFFQYNNEKDLKTELDTAPIVPGFSNWDRTFMAKLDFARDKDIKDWLNFVTPYGLKEFDNNYTYYNLFSPDDLPTIDPENAVEGTCE
jgi:hypothetical protein